MMVAVKRITWGDWIQGTYVISDPHCYGLIGSAVFRITHKKNDSYFVERLDRVALEAASLTFADAKEFAQNQIEEELREIIRFPDEENAAPRAKTYRAKFQPEAMFYAGNGDHGPIIDWLMASGAFKAGVSFDQKTGIYSVIFEAQRAMSEYVPPGFWIVRDKAKGFVAMCDYYFHETYEAAE